MLPGRPRSPPTKPLSPRSTLRPTLLQVGLRVVNVVNRTTLVMNADANMLRHVNAMLLSRGRPDVFAPLLPAAQPGKSRPKRSRLENCHLRFSLNRKPMQLMRYLLCMQDLLWPMWLLWLLCLMGRLWLLWLLWLLRLLRLL